MAEKHSRPVPGGRGFWWTESLWRAVEGLPVHQVPLTDILELDEDCWFGGQAPTCREVAEHSRRITDADLGHPVILASDGRLMNGGHRIARAWLEGLAAVDAVRFEVDPEPDWIVPAAPRTGHHGSVGETDRGGDDGDESAVPGVYPGSEGAATVASFTLDVDGELFALRPAECGGTDYTWLSGPNEGYGFGSNGAVDQPMDDHRESVRTFLAQVDPTTGYIEDD